MRTQKVLILVNEEPENTRLKDQTLKKQTCMTSKLSQVQKKSIILAGQDFYAKCPTVSMHAIAIIHYPTDSIDLQSQNTVIISWENGLYTGVCYLQ